MSGDLGLLVNRFVALLRNVYISEIENELIP